MVRSRCASLLLVSVLLGVVPSRASDPVCVYGVISRVALEPETKNPTTAVVLGTFIVARGVPGDGDVYTEPAYGVLYYSIREGDEANTRIEWNDLKSVAGTGTCVAFGSRYDTRPSVRSGCGDPTATKPDPYVAVGLTQIAADTLRTHVVGLLGFPRLLEPAECGVPMTFTPTLAVHPILTTLYPDATYVFTIETESGSTVTSPPVLPSSGRVSWTPDVKLKPAEYNWTVQASQGEWVGPSALYHFNYSFNRGNANGDSSIDLSDPIYLLEHSFNGGPDARPRAAGDVDSNGEIEITDAIYLLGFLFLGGPPPGPPYTES